MFTLAVLAQTPQYTAPSSSACAPLWCPQPGDLLQGFPLQSPQSTNDLSNFLHPPFLLSSRVSCPMSRYTLPLSMVYYSIHWI